MSLVTRRKSCRLCDSGRVELALPIAPSPIAEAYVTSSGLGQAQPTFPLDLHLCLDCGHAQSLDVVDPEVLFRDYIFTTSSSGSLLKHFEDYANEIVNKFNVAPGSLIVEVGSNDGSLLKYFQSHDMRVVGIDPAREIAHAATAENVETIPEFFNAALARNLRKERGAATVVCANNVFAHSDDLSEIVEGVRELLIDDGVFVFEVSYLLDIVDSYLFDTIYHEHVSYHSIMPLQLFFRRHGMELFDVQRIGSKGGSIRGFAQRAPTGQRQVSSGVHACLEMEEERKLSHLQTFKDYGARINKRKLAVADFVKGERRKGKMIAGYGASTTATTLMWHFDLTRELSFICDDNSKKHGLYAPGCHIPVVPSEELYIRSPDSVIVLAWQYYDVIAARHLQFTEQGGKFVVPLPDLMVI